MLDDLLDWLRRLLGLDKPTALVIVRQYPQTWQVAVVDRRGRVVEKDGVLVGVTATNAVLYGTTARYTTDGLATFTSLTFAPADPTMSVVLTFSSAGLTSAVSDPITLTPVAAALQFVQAPPASAVDARAFPQPVILQLVSAKGAAVPQSGVAVSVAASNGGIVVGSSSGTTDAQGRVSFAIGVDDPAL